MDMRRRATIGCNQRLENGILAAGFLSGHDKSIDIPHDGDGAPFAWFLKGWFGTETVPKLTVFVVRTPDCDQKNTKLHPKCPLLGQKHLVF